MTLAEKYGIQPNSNVGSIELTKNPYTFEGTFKELYDLTVKGNLKILTQNGMMVGGSVGGYESVEADNLASAAFMKAFMGKPLMQYVTLAKGLVEANIIPTIVSEKPLRITILNGLVTLDMYGNEIHEEADHADDNEETERDTCEVPGSVGDNIRDIKNYIRRNVGYCFARGCNPTIKYNLQKDVYEVSGIEWGRKLSRAELEELERIASVEEE